MPDLRSLQSSMERFIWDADLTSAPRWRVLLVRPLRILHAVVGDLAEGQLTLRAMSLVYTTLLSLVPLLAVSFSVLKAFGVHNQLEPALSQFLAPMGDKGAEITARIIGFVENVNAGVLGSVGLAFLFYTVVALLQKVERAFNYAWRVSEQRPLAQRFSDYLSVILIGPVLVFSALGLTASVNSTGLVQRLRAIEPFGTLLHTAGQLVPYLLVIVAFAFIYVFVPNTRVRVRSALLGAAVAGILWETVGWGFASFVVGSAKYTAIYSSFAILILFMIWLYLSWLILLVGASIAFYHQHPEHLSRERHGMELSARMRERLALLVMHLVGQAFYEDRPALTRAALAEQLHVPVGALEPVLAALEGGGLLRETRDTPARHLPGRPLEGTPVKAVLDAVRAAGESTHLCPERLARREAVEAVSGELEAATAHALQGTTLKDLALWGHTRGEHTDPRESLSA